MGTEVRKTLAANVKALREHHTWTQVDLAARSGVKQTTISALERGVHAVTIDTLDGLAHAFRVAPWSLLIPNLPATNHRAGAAKVLQAYVQLPDDGRRQLERVAEAESRYHFDRP